MPFNLFLSSTHHPPPPPPFPLNSLPFMKERMAPSSSLDDVPKIDIIFSQ